MQLIRENRVPLAVLAVLLVAGYVVPRFLLPPDPMMLERDSDRIGWEAHGEGAEVALDIVDRVNAERLARGLAPLRWHDGLAEFAGRWSEEMLVSGYRHSSAGFREHPDFAGTGENIAMGQLDATELHVGWMRSDGHRANILHPNFTDIGIGIVCRNDGRIWATQIFGVRPGVAMSDPPMPPVDPIVGDGRGGAACPRDPLELFRIRR